MFNRDLNQINNDEDKQLFFLHMKYVKKLKGRVMN